MLQMVDYLLDVTVASLIKIPYDVYKLLSERNEIGKTDDEIRVASRYAFHLKYSILVSSHNALKLHTCLIMLIMMGLILQYRNYVSNNILLDVMLIDYKILFFVFE